jgi:esterase/lipase superfamily enzyme
MVFSRSKKESEIAAFGDVGYPVILLPTSIKSYCENNDMA